MAVKISLNRHPFSVDTFSLSKKVQSVYILYKVGRNPAIGKLPDFLCRGDVHFGHVGESCVRRRRRRPFPLDFFSNEWCRRRRRLRRCPSGRSRKSRLSAFFQPPILKRSLPSRSVSSSARNQAPYLSMSAMAFCCSFLACRLQCARWEPAKEAEMRTQSLFKTSPDGGIYPPLSPKAFYAKFKYALQKRLLPIWL